MYAYNYGATCSTFVEQVQLGAECEDFEISGGAYFSMWQTGQTNCQADKITTIPEVQWDGMVSSCSGALQGEEECEGGGFCTPLAPPGYDQQLCVFAQGPGECPEGDFSEKLTVYSGADDTRTCGVCWCGKGAATCEATLDTFATSDCTGAVQANVVANVACDEAAAGAGSVQVNFTGTESCPVETPPEANGEVAAGGEFTYCCQPA